VNFTLYPIYELASDLDDEPFDLARLPFDITEGDPFRLERIEGTVAVPLAVWLFFAWELGRWRMRRKYPLEKPLKGLDL